MGIYSTKPVKEINKEEFKHLNEPLPAASCGVSR